MKALLHKTLSKPGAPVWGRIYKSVIKKVEVIEPSEYPFDTVCDNNDTIEQLNEVFPDLDLSDYDLVDITITPASDVVEPIKAGDKIVTQEMFNKMYGEYQDLLLFADTAGWYADQFSIANEERNKLKEVVEPSEEEMYEAGKECSIVKTVYDLAIFKAGAEWYQRKIREK